MDASERINALEEARQRVSHEMLAFLKDTPGDWSAEDSAKWDRYNRRHDDLDGEIRRVRDDATAEAEEVALRQADERIYARQPAAATARVNEDDALRAFLNGDAGDTFTVPVSRAWQERRALRAGASPDEARALAWDTGNVASAVPTTMARELYQVLEANIAALKMPVRRINTSTGEPMDFPRVSAHAIATQVSGQGTTLAGTDPTFAKLTLTPDKYGELVIVASEVVSDTAVDVGSFLAMDIGRALGRVVDAAEVARMVATNAGLGSVNTGGSLIGPTYDNLINLVYSVNDAYRSGGNAAFLFRDSTAGSIRKIRDGAGGTEGTPLWQPGFNGGLTYQQPSTLLDFPVYTDPNVASIASNAIIGAFGDWNGYFLRTVGDVVLDRNDSRYFDTDQVAFRGRWRVRGGYQDSGAVKLLKQNV